jgi:hypothetical protein
VVTAVGKTENPPWSEANWAWVFGEGWRMATGALL